MAAKDIGKDIAGKAALEACGKAVGKDLAAAWFTVRTICQVSYKAIKSYRLSSKQSNGTPIETGSHAPAYGGGGGTSSACPGYVPAVSAEDEANDQSCIPWGPAPGNAHAPASAAPVSLSDDDGYWVEELRRATESRTRDNLRLLGELQGLGDKIDRIPLDNLYDDLRNAMRLLLEYLQFPGHRSAMDRLRQAEEAATRVCINERSLVMSLSALRIRIVITYLHAPKHSKGVDPSMEDKEQDKKQCQYFLGNALAQRPLEALCRKFLAASHGQGKQPHERVDAETMLAFDIILEVISSMYLLEPFRPSEGLLPKAAPGIVLHALSTYCDRGLGNSVIYADLARALKAWESSPQRQERWALHCLYESTGGPQWACSEGWDRLFEADLCDLYGVSIKAGRVSKISLGNNNLEGRIPPELENLHHLQELSLPGNQLFGKINAALWDLQSLRVVALQGNSFTGTPPGIFTPAVCPGALAGATTGGLLPEPQRRALGVEGKVETLDPGRLEVCKGEWFACSWKITNTGSVAFGKGTKLSRGMESSSLGGVEDVPVNPLAPGEEQTVAVMQQAPLYDSWGLQDEWALVNRGLDFVNDDGAKAKTPVVKVLPRIEGGGRRPTEDANSPTLANTVFVASQRHRRGSSHCSTGSSQYFQHTGSFSSHNAPR